MKRLLLFAAVLIMLFSVAACSGTHTVSADPTEAPATEAPEEPTAEPSEIPTEEPNEVPTAEPTEEPEDEDPEDEYSPDYEKAACWPVDLNGDGEDEYFYADLELLTGDFVSFVWLEDKDHNRLGDTLYCGTGHVAFGSFALVESPEYGTCIMSTTPEYQREFFGYSLMKLVDGRLETVYTESFYSYDDEGENTFDPAEAKAYEERVHTLLVRLGLGGIEGENTFDPAEAKAYEERVNALYASGRLLITTDRWGLMQQGYFCTAPETAITPGMNDTPAVICAYGSTGAGIEWLAGSEYADDFIIYYEPAYSVVKVEPFTGE